MYRGSHIIGSLRPREVQAQPCVWDKHLMIPHNLTSHLKRVYNSFLPNKIVFHDICRIRFHKIPLMTIYNHPNLEHGIIPSEAIITIRLPNTLTLTNHSGAPYMAVPVLIFTLQLKTKDCQKHESIPFLLLGCSDVQRGPIHEFLTSQSIPGHSLFAGLRQLTKKKW